MNQSHGPSATKTRQPSARSIRCKSEGGGSRRSAKRRRPNLETLFQTLIPLALALLASLGLGRVAARLGIPRVTIYLLVGFALGPYALARGVEPGSLSSWFLLIPSTETPLDIVSELAIGFVLFGIGGNFLLPTLRRVGAPIWALSGVEIATTSLLVGAAVGVGTGDWRLALLAPALAVSTAPSATLVTLREIEAEGPATRALLLCVGHNNLAALFAFPILLSLAFGTGNALSATASAGAAMGIGGLMGLMTALGLEAISDRRDLVLLGLAAVLATLGACHAIQPGSTGLAMLGCFSAGVTLANASPHWPSLSRYLENTVYPLYVLFFIAAGSQLHVDALGQAGVLGLAFVSARLLGKLLGARLGLQLAGWNTTLPPALGGGLLCQAGVALGLVAALEAAAPEQTTDLRNVVVASVVFFELVGPWLLRRTAIRAGEVKLASLLPHAEALGTDAFRWVALEIRRNLGLLRSPPTSTHRELTVRHAMRRRPQTVGPATPFERVLKILGETESDLLPVVDSEGRLAGVISYDEVKNALYDPILRGVVIAKDLTIPVDAPLSPEDGLPEALEKMDSRRLPSWPVVEDGILRGMVRRSDLYALIRRGRSSNP